MLPAKSIKEPMPDSVVELRERSSVVYLQVVSAHHLEGDFLGVGDMPFTLEIFWRRSFYLLYHIRSTFQI